MTRRRTSAWCFSEYSIGIVSGEVYGETHALWKGRSLKTAIHLQCLNPLKWVNELLMGFLCQISLICFSTFRIVPIYWCFFNGIFYNPEFYGLYKPGHPGVNKKNLISDWVVVSNIFGIFTPIWGNDPI